MNGLMGTKGLMYARILAAVLAQAKIYRNDAQVVPVGVGARHLTLGVRVKDTARLKTVQGLDEQFAYAARTKHCLVVRDRGLVLFQVELPTGYWQTFTRDEISRRQMPASTVGIAENWTGIEYQFEQKAPHGLFAGTTGSGKSEAIKTTIIGLAQTYRPSELGLLIADGKKVDYGAEFNNLAHLIRPVAKDVTGYQQVIEYTYRELAYRKAHAIKDGRRIVLIVDEAHDAEIMGLESNVAALQQIGKQGRAFNVNLILGTQKPSQKDLPGIFDLLINRFVGLVSDPQMSFQLTGRGQMGAHNLTGEGDFLHVVGPSIQRFQVCMATNRDYDSLPRAEGSAPTHDEPVNVVELDPLPSDDEPKPGRPSNAIEPATLAYYANRHPNLPSVRQAQADGVSYARHKMHIDFWQQFLRELKTLRSGA
jgi:DNA segregation ATPase FtsK/SpoIIIE-like protein